MQHRFTAPPRQFVQRLAASSSGDLRLAVNNLQFMLTQGENFAQSIYICVKKIAYSVGPSETRTDQFRMNPKSDFPSCHTYYSILTESSTSVDLVRLGSLVLH